MLLTGKNIIKSFKNGNEKLVVLDNVSVEMENGEFVSVMGASGSGKSTLLYSLSGMDTIDSGEIIFDNKVLSEVDEDTMADIRRNEMGFVFQQPTLLKNFDIIDNIVFPQMRDKGKEKKSLYEEAFAIMKELGIYDLKDRKINQVSGGQLQRADIARALMNKPKILFADEPTGALNSKTSEEIMDVFSTIHGNGTAIMIVTHDVKVAGRADRVIFMKDGKIVGGIYLKSIPKEDISNRVERVIETTRELVI